MDDVQVVEGKVEELQPDPDNANTHTERGMYMLERSLRERGVGRPVVADKNKRLIGGEAVTQTAADIGLEKAIFVHTKGDTLIVHVRDDLELGVDEAARELSIEDNRIGQVNLRFDTERLKEYRDKGVDLTKWWTARELAACFEMAWGDPDAPNTFDDIDDQLPGAGDLKAEMHFESDEIFDIPPLREDMLAPLPQPIDTWAGPDASDPDWEGFWLYCYGTDSIRGLETTRAVLAFYTDDYRFENWFEEPARYVSRALNAGITCAVAPNFSLWVGAPQAFHIFNVFRSRWLARYMQEAGLYVIPDANWADERSFGFCLAGIPKKPPCLSVQVQTLDTPADALRQKEGLERVLRELQPETLLLYGGGQQTRENLAGSLPDELPVVWLTSRVIRRHDRVMSAGPIRQDA